MSSSTSPDGQCQMWDTISPASPQAYLKRHGVEEGSGDTARATRIKAATGDMVTDWLPNMVWVKARIDHYQKKQKQQGNDIHIGLAS